MRGEAAPPEQTLQHNLTEQEPPDPNPGKEQKKTTHQKLKKVLLCLTEAIDLIHKQGLYLQLFENLQLPSEVHIAPSNLLYLWQHDLVHFI